MNEPDLDECEKCTDVYHFVPRFPAAIACRHKFFQNMEKVRTIPIQYSKAPPWCPKKATDEETWRKEHGEIKTEH